MKCKECPDYAKCVKESNLAIKRKSCPKAKTERKKTNADRIRAMNDYELAEFLYGFAYGVEALGACWDCQGEALEWLREPAER